MPEYLAPGVFVEEVSYRAKSIEGVSTTTTGFVGPTRYGPIDLEPELITSLVEFERIYGGRQQLNFTGANGGTVDNYMWNAARAFFQEGGKRLYVARVFGGDAAAISAARARVTGTVPPANVTISARFPGEAGESRVRLQFYAGANRYAVENEGGTDVAKLRGTTHRDVVYINNVTAGAEGLYILTRDEQQDTWTFDNENGTSFELQQILADGDTDAIVRVVTATILVEPTQPGLPFFAAAELALDDQHRRNGKPDSVFDYFAEQPESQSAARSNPIVISALTVAEATAERDAAQLLVDAAQATDDANDLALTAATDARDDAQDDVDNPPGGSDPAVLQQTLDDAEQALTAAQEAKDQSAEALVQAQAWRDTAQAIVALGDADRSGLAFASDYLVANEADNRFTLQQLRESDGSEPFMDAEFFLTQGADGEPPNGPNYVGAINPTTNLKSGLVALEDLEDVSIVAAPGSTYVETNAQAIANALISHAQRMRYRIAVLDSVLGQSITQVREYRGKFDSKYAAFYYPWVRITDPETGNENLYPPSGFVSGIYARNDIERAVYKAPANEVVNLALGFEKTINTGQQEVLNPEGVNCFRFFEGRGNRLWGARCATSDPEWKYVNLRRYFIYLERSIDKGTQWAVFEPNGERLWANIRTTIEDFLLNEFQNGALLGERPDQAFFVKCDRSTMTQNDIDNGRLVCQIGVAALKPAEFVIFRIGQWTADSNS
ncbi:MAG: phage tail sheath subtilisin-like domain-containing protein [Erythrobacter sp.]|nr:phage tail sheath subtilisin-like domain-containing protein [Erythrobacter sp.]